MDSLGANLSSRTVKSFLLCLAGKFDCSSRSDNDDTSKGVELVSCLALR